MPLLNDHDLESELGVKLVDRIPKTTVDLHPLDFSSNRYSQLSPSLNAKDVEKRDFFDVVDEEDGEFDDPEAENVNDKRGSCSFCCETGSWHGHYEDSIRGMRKHMRTR